MKASPLKIFLLCLSFGLGIGVFSVAFFIWLLLGHNIGSGISILIGLCLLVVLLAWHIKKHSNLSLLSPPVSNKANPAYLALFCVIALSSAAIFIFMSVRNPHGGWDAWAISNLRARFLFRGIEHWKDAFLIYWSHSDYPLLLPGAVAGSWSIIGKETPLIPATIAFIFTFGTAGLLYYGVTILKGKNQGMLAAITLLSMPFVIKHGASQCADTPVGFFFLATIILLTLYDLDLKKNGSWLVLAGLSAGMAAWTKTEGMLFMFVVISAKVVINTYKKEQPGIKKWLFSFISGLLPILAVILCFKLVLPISNYLICTKNLGHVYRHLYDPTRYATIFILMLKGMFNTEDWFIYPIMLLVCLGVSWPADKRFKSITAYPMAVIFLMLCGYFLMYMFMPYEVVGVIACSLNRLYVQLWPSVLFIFFLLFDPGDLNDLKWNENIARFYP